VYSGYLCSKCTKIKDIIRIYGTDRVEESLKYIFVRDEVPIKNRVDLVKNGDSSYKEKQTKM
tara:strand:- start:512 stop:697 length:186 start_codon:yes stop_codon:yes gene_type:complete